MNPPAPLYCTFHVLLTVTEEYFAQIGHYTAIISQSHDIAKGCLWITSDLSIIMVHACKRHRQCSLYMRVCASESPPFGEIC